MKVLVGTLAVILAAPVGAVDFFSQENSGRRSSNEPSLDQRVQLLERRINTLSSIVLRLDSLQQEMQQLRGDVEVQNHAVESLKKRQSDLYTDIDQRISKLSGETSAGVPAQMDGTTPQPTGAVARDAMQPQVQPPPGAPSWQSTPIAGQPSEDAPSPRPAWPTANQVQPKPGAASLPPVISSTNVTGAAPGQLSSSSLTVTTPQAKPPVAPPQDSEGEKSSYQTAFNLLMDRKYDKAQQSFQSFLKDYPGSRLADNAQYWLAEANYVTRDFDSALAEFTKVVQNHPSSPKISDALLKIGYIQYEKKQWGVARETLSSLVNRYPNSTASQLAKKRLDKMQGEGH